MTDVNLGVLNNDSKVSFLGSLSRFLNIRNFLVLIDFLMILIYSVLNIRKPLINLEGFRLD